MGGTGVLVGGAGVGVSLGGSEVGVAWGDGDASTVVGLGGGSVAVGGKLGASVRVGADAEGSTAVFIPLAGSPDPLQAETSITMSTIRHNPDIFFENSVDKNIKGETFL